MGWVWSDDDSQLNTSSDSDERYFTRKIVKSQCRTEEIEPGKFIKKCEKIEELLRTCTGKIEILCRDINVHIPHHISPKIPSYNLRAAHKSLQENWGKYLNEASLVGIGD